MKTIGDLQAKWWYRLVKVGFIVTSLLIIVCGNILYFSEAFNEVNTEKSFIYCNNKGDSVLSFDDANLYYIFDFDDKNLSYKELATKKPYLFTNIFRTCIGDTKKELSEDGVIELQSYLDTRQKFETEDSPFTTEMFYDLPKSDRIFDFQYEFFSYSVKTNNIQFFVILILSNIGFLILLEIIRRFSYYVLLGKVFPKKGE